MIRIVPHDKTRPNKFAVVGRVLRYALVAGALRLDHIGSTSVPSLAAKDVIDSQITVTALEPEIREGLKSIGDLERTHLADHIPPGANASPDDWAKWVFTEPSGQRATNVHVRLAGRPNQRLALLFRDFLRSNGVAKEAYERVKVALARLQAEDMDAYSAVKNPVCDIILEAAEAWAAPTKMGAWAIRRLGS